MTDTAYAITADPIAPADGWFIPEQRLCPPPPAQRGALFRTLSKASGWFGRSEIPDVFPLINIHRGLFPAWLWFASRLMPFGKLPASIRELLILRTAWNCRSRYEWGQHVEVALSVGMTDADILAATLSTPEQCSDPKVRAALLSCDELCRNHYISEATWQQLSHEFKPAYCMEIMMLVGHYQMLAGVINSAGLALEPAMEAKLQAFYQRISV
ncbi:carboxymuconolactone decarboxylase family protein [Alkanindiges sp. WGS2144]|uniref:carboxymuconolactone decarboxylase family protein n=1 Tax=Alkanindiges sp. WGS2144 TaxID=3366808 RepID=UPI003752C009